MKDLEKVWWNLTNEMRGKNEITPKKLLEVALQKNIPLSIEIVERFLDRRSGISYTPEHICGFIIKILKSEKPKEILDPFVGIGSLFTKILKELPNIEATGINRIFESHELASYFTRDYNTDLQIGNPFLVLDNFRKKFDCIVSHPPFSIRNKDFSIKFDEENFEIKDDLEKLVLLKSCNLLEDNGIGIFIVSPNFFFRRSEKKVINNLEKFDLYIEAALEIPAGSFYPSTGIGGFLVIIRKGTQPDKLFIGEINDNKKTQAKLLKNFITKKKGKTPQEGTFIDLNKFESLQKVIQELDLIKLANRLGFKPVKMTTLVSEINKADKSIPAGFEIKPNSFFLPKKADEIIFSDLPSDDYNYNRYFTQIVLNQEIISTQHFKFILKTNFGRKWIDYVTVGRILKNFTRKRFLESTFYIMLDEKFNEISSIVEDMNDFSFYFLELAGLITTDPRNVKEAKEILEYNKKYNTIENWLDSLPFPVASILWNYLTADTIEKEVKRLIYFFEAFTQFNATIITSGLTSNEDFYKTESKSWFGGEGYHKEWYKRTNFGNWINFYSGLSSNLRRLLEDPDKKQMCLNLFNRADEDFLRIISNKKIINILDDAPRKYRNILAHEGEKPLRFYKKALIELKECLNALRSLVGYKYTNVKFLLPKKGEKKRGVIYHKANHLIGVKTPFPSIEVQTTEIMDTEFIYMLPENQEDPLQLKPFIFISSTPESVKTSCYFYNKITDDKPVWNLYHQGELLDQEIPNEELIKALKYLQPYEP